MIPASLRPGTGERIVIRGARGNNLKGVTAEFPLGKFICVTGVSGSGKSTLVNETLRPILSKALYRSYDQPLPYDSVEGIEHIDKLVVVDQSPIGRSPRSNPATYSNVFSDIRKLFEMTPDAQIRGFKAGRFSFNVKGGRCEECRGAGVQTIEMNFLPDVYVRCRACGGHRYNRETLEVRYKGRNIDDVLNMTVNMAVEFSRTSPRSTRSCVQSRRWGSATSRWASPARRSRAARASASSSPPSCRSAIRAARSIFSTNRRRASTSRISACCSTCSTNSSIAAIR